MKRLFALLIIAVLAFGAFGVSAQDAPTIAEIVIASASADTPEFATLLTAVQAADPAVVEALSNPEAELTVFAPTDAAFAALAEALGEEAFAGVLADTEALTGILLFHVVEGKVMSSDVVAALEANDGSFSVPSLNGQYIDIELDDMGDILVDGAKLNLDMVDIEASNGVIHVIDSVILPESRTLAEIVVEAASAEMDAEFTTLLAAVSAADPGVLEALSNPDAELTVFAPTDAAFAAAFEALGIEPEALLADTETLTSILLYHVLDGRVGSADVAALLAESMDAPVVVTMLNGADAEIVAGEEGITIAGATIVVTDIDAANGIIHVIDAVMLPPAE
jgi:uncharacterized surface protein with fasciclin (FAS1) repeats